MSGNNFILDLKSHPEYGFYCGHVWIIVKVTDVKSETNIDPVPKNNMLAKEYKLKCPGGKKQCKQQCKTISWIRKYLLCLLGNNF